jgi:hypothetical protein
MSTVPTSELQLEWKLHGILPAPTCELQANWELHEILSPPMCELQVNGELHDILPIATTPYANFYGDYQLILALQDQCWGLTGSGWSISSNV